MLRPTLNELISGMQRTIMEALMPELTSPYAQGQAMSAIGMLAHAAAVLDGRDAGALLVRRNRGEDELDPVERAGFAGLLGGAQVRGVHRVERAAEEAYLHAGSARCTPAVAAAVTCAPARSRARRTCRW